jgi:hypothetical protein
MKRSEINSAIRTALAVLQKHQFYLPPLLTGPPKDGVRRGLSASVSDSTAWVGTSPILVQDTSMNLELSFSP